MNRRWRRKLAAIGGVTFSLACVMFLLILCRPAGVATASSPAVPLSGESFVYLFDPTTATFVFTFTLPTHNANPWDVVTIAGSGHQEVWFTERGADRIGSLIYTNTHEYEFREYPLTPGSQPLNLAVYGGYIWFTEAGRNRIGRLNPATEQVDEFEAPTPNSGPADLDIAADGSIWFTEMMADQVAQLRVNSPANYTITEYFTTSLGGGRPYGIAVSGDQVFFAQTAGNRVTQFTPPDHWVHIYGFVPGVPFEPYKLVLRSGEVWGTERAGNRISLFRYWTFPIIDPYNLTPANSMPMGLVVDSNNFIWFTQWRANQIGRLIPSGAPQKDYYPLPLVGLAPTGITIDNTGAIWVLASSLYRIYLPLVSKS